MATTASARLVGGPLPLPAITRAMLVRWGSQGLWAIADQALFAASNLLVNLLLARWLAPAEYGAFVTAYTLLLFVSVLHTAFLTEPMLIFGADRYRAGLSEYVAVMRRYHWRVMGATGLALLAVAAGLHATGLELLARASAGVAIAAPCILFSWLGRRACYVVGRPQRAALAGATSLALVGAGAAALARLDLLTVFSAQLLLAAAALAATAVMRGVIRREQSAPLDAEARRSIWPDHWKYGRWVGATGLLSWLAAYGYYLVLPAVGGLAAAGSLKALTNFVMPIMQADAALITLLTPAFVRAHRVHHRLGHATMAAAAGFAAESCLYWVLLVLFGHQLLEVFYGGAYDYSTALLVLLGTLPLFNGLSNVCGTALRAREQTDAVFLATTISAAAGLAVGLTAVASQGIAGAVLGLAVGGAVQTAMMTALLARKAPVR